MAYQQGQQPVIVQPKNAAIGLIVSFFLPGVGSMINGEVGKGVLILALYIVSFFLIFVLIGIPCCSSSGSGDWSTRTKAHRGGIAATGSSVDVPCGCALMACNS